MFGGLAFLRNLLCLAHGAAHGEVLLLDPEQRRVVSRIAVRDDDGEFTDASAVAVDPSCRVYVADTRNDVVRCYTAFGREVGRVGTACERGPGTVERDRVGVLDKPCALAVCGAELWVAGGERKLVRAVQRFSLGGAAFGGGAARGYVRAFGEADRRYGAPRGLWADELGVLVADTLHGVVQRFTPDARFIGEVGLGGEDVCRPVAVLRLPDGDLLVADHGDHAGLVRVTLRGIRQPLPPWPPGVFDQPSALARDASGRIYVLDRHGERVQRLHSDLTYDGVVFDLLELLDEA